MTMLMIIPENETTKVAPLTGTDPWPSLWPMGVAAHDGSVPMAAALMAVATR
jgi:hypothetical protein